jgi:putative hydrolase of the HAD superfamily
LWRKRAPFRTTLDPPPDMSVRLVVFDVDGTLYERGALRARMLLELSLFALRHPLRFRELMVVREYRSVHENFGPDPCENLANALLEQVGRNLSIHPETVGRIVEEWLFRRPLRHLRNRCVPEVETTLQKLRLRGVAVAVLSDHYPVLKLEALGLHFEHTYYSTREDLNCLKPNPRLLSKILSDQQVRPIECVMIGDRDDRDGSLARAVGAGFVLYPDRRRRGSLLDAIDEAGSARSPS